MWWTDLEVGEPEVVFVYLPHVPGVLHRDVRTQHGPRAHRQEVLYTEARDGERLPLVGPALRDAVTLVTARLVSAALPSSHIRHADTLSTQTPTLTCHLL